MPGKGQGSTKLGSARYRAIGQCDQHQAAQVGRGDWSLSPCLHPLRPSATHNQALRLSSMALTSTWTTHLHRVYHPKLPKLLLVNAATDHAPAKIQVNVMTEPCPARSGMADSEQPNYRSATNLRAFIKSFTSYGKRASSHKTLQQEHAKQQRGSRQTATTGTGNGVRASVKVCLFDPFLITVSREGEGKQSRHAPLVEDEL